MPKKKQNKFPKKFLAMWDCNGLESLFDISDFEGDAMIAGLKGETFKAPFNLSMMLMRARANSQRSYEIYIFSAEDDIDYDTIVEMFKTSPQTIVNLIRMYGHMIHSDYDPEDRRVIV